MSWTANGVGSSGFLLEAGKAQSRERTWHAIAAHCGRLWCLWQDLEEHLWFTATTEDGQQFMPREPFPCSQTGEPIIASLNEQLHAILIHPSGTASHYCLTNGEQHWKIICNFYIGKYSRPAIYAFHNRLFLAYVQDDELYCMVWNHDALEWTNSYLITKGEQCYRGYFHPAFGFPRLFVVEGVLHLLCLSYATGCEYLQHIYDENAKSWIKTDNTPGETIIPLASYASYGGALYMGFIRGHTGYVAKYSGGVSSPQEETVIETTCADVPQIAILNGRIHAIFPDETSSRDLRWYSRSILDYSPSSWMAGIPDDTLLSNMTIPGTHDSPARTTIPFTKTQNLTITQQLALGIRFFDLRLRLHKDGRLYCYHGGIPLGWPRTLSFESVMDEIWDFLHPPSAENEPTETVLISINNDNNSRGIGNAPAIFYNAIGAAIISTPPYPDGTSRWVVETVTSRLGDVRGRAVLLRRYPGHPAIKPALRHGLDLSAWVNDSPDFTIVTPTGVVVRLQDKWKYSERIGLRDLVASKSAYVEAMFQRAMSSRPSTPSGSDSDADPDPDSHSDSDASVDDFVLVRPRHDAARTSPSNRGEVWFVNFCSAVGEPMEHGEVAQARWVAVGGYSNAGEWIDGVNVSIGDYLRKQGAGGAGKRRLGIVPMDYPELPQGNDLVSQLIETNF